MTRPSEGPPATVSGQAPTTQGGDVWACWAWTEPAVWTARMLTALERGVKGGVWVSLIDKVWSKVNLVASARTVVANQGAAGVDRITVAEFTRHLDEKGIAWSASPRT